MFTSASIAARAATFFPVLLVCLIPFTQVSGQGSFAYTQKVDPRLQNVLRREGKAEALVVFREQAQLESAAHLPGKEAKGVYVFRQLQATAEKVQSGVREWLRRNGIAHHSFFIANALYLPQADPGLIERLAQRPEVAQIIENGRLLVPEAEETPPTPALRMGIEWGLNKIQAPAVWAMGYTGKGIVVGGQDTGYDWIHPTIRKQYRGWLRDTSANHAYNWHDAIRSYSPLHRDTVNPCGLNLLKPCDDNSHGTHTMGTMVGDDGQGNQIGVAPGATWIGCRNMERGYGSPFTYLECFQWFLAPTDATNNAPNPKLAPDVINNSWGCPSLEGCNPSNYSLLETAVNNLRAAGIFVVISAGNDGPSCMSIADPPAIFPAGFAVGASNSLDTIARFSSRGPVVDQSKSKTYPKPDVVAPGVAVRSAIRNNGFASLNGTSMAGPHVAGAVALILSANPRLRGNVARIESILKSTARPITSPESCGGFPGDSIPNATYGYGRINVLAAVQAALQITTPTREEQAPQALRVFPNPAQDIVTLETGLFEGVGRFTLWDLSGKVCLQREVESWGDPFVSFELPALQQGMYFYRWQGGNSLYSGKLLIQGQR